MWTDTLPADCCYQCKIFNDPKTTESNLQFSKAAPQNLYPVPPTSNPLTELQEPRALRQFLAGTTGIPGIELKAVFALEWQKMIPAKKCSVAGRHNDLVISMNSKEATNS